MKENTRMRIIRQARKSFKRKMRLLIRNLRGDRKIALALKKAELSDNRDTRKVFDLFRLDHS